MTINNESYASLRQGRFPYTFTAKEVVGNHGHHFPLLTSNEYPWMNVQIVPTPSHQRDMILEHLQRHHGMVASSQGRTDFVAIQAGGGTEEHPTISINAQNFRQVGVVLGDCLQAAADYWASRTDTEKL